MDMIDKFFVNNPHITHFIYRLAIMASERLLILQPHNWSLRRDHGMLLYYSRYALAWYFMGSHRRNV